MQLHQYIYVYQNHEENKFNMKRNINKCKNEN